jgi:hypothetical protein
MLRIFLSALLLAGPEVVCRLGPADPPYNAYSDEGSSGDALELAGKVNAALVSWCRPNCPTISMFRNPTASDLMLIREEGRVKLVYKPAFFTSVYEKYGDGGILAIMAHEVGHAIDGAMPTPWMKASWNPELRADAWAGCALARMTLSSGTLQAGLNALSKYPSPSHPNWTVRIPVLQAGYTQCGGDASKLTVGAVYDRPR